ncbi:AAA family ATPase [Candidatus Micrarchaeota archaeon]|nr:AAA family ATPase [Candidatus Micrarchaeota archaeon]
MGEYFGIEPSKVAATGSRTNIVYYSKLLASFFAQHCGKGAHNKHVPPLLFDMPKEFFLEFLKGFAAGDGYTSPEGKIEITSVSRRLILELNWLCRMHGIKSAFSSFIVKERSLDGYMLPKTTAFRLHIGARQNPFRLQTVNRMKISRAKIKRITRLPFDGYVYDLCGCDNEAFFGGEAPILLHNTNRPNSIDPALRRPGRFDREIELGVPDKRSRKEILQIHTRGMPLAKDVSLDELASVTHGFVGADLQSLTKEAAMKVLRRVLPKIKLQDAEIPQNVLDELTVTRHDFQNALREIQPSALREVFVEIPNVRWNQVGGLDEVKRELREAVEMPLKNPGVFKRLGIRPVRGILLFGPPGTGKTLLAKAVATESESNFISIKGPELISKWVGESLAYDEEVIVQVDGATQRRKIGELVDENLSENAGQLTALKQRMLVQTLDEAGKAQWAPVTDYLRHAAPTQLYEVHTRSGRRIQLTADHGLFVLDEGMIKTIPTQNLVPGESFVAIPNRATETGQDVELDLLALLGNDPHVTVGNVSGMVQDAINRFGLAKVNQILLGYSRQLDVLQRVKGDMRIPVQAFKRMAELRAACDSSQLTVSTKASRDRIPERLKFTPELAYWVGIWVAEGDFNGRGARVHNQNPENRQRLKACLDSLGISYSENKNAIVTSTLSAKILRALGLNHGADQKRMPAIAFSLRRDVLASLLSGYYSGDGSVYGNAHRSYIEACTASAGLANDLMRLLLPFRIVSIHYERTDKRYGTLMHKVQFSGVENFQKFATIGFSDSKRNECVAAYIVSKKWTRTAQLPIDKTLRELLQDYGFEEWAKSKTVGSRILKELFRWAPAEKTAPYRQLLENDVHWDLVVDVRKVAYGKPYVYDLSVDSTQRFVAGFGGLYVHNSEKYVRETFRKARLAAPCIVFIDELDSVASARGTDQGSKVTERVVDSLLTEMDGLKDLKDVLIIGATNRIDLIDPALLRPGRFDKLIEIPYPDLATRLAIFKVHTSKMPLTKDVDLKELAKVTEDYSGADVEGLCREAAMVALRENIGAAEVNHDHFMKATKTFSVLVSKKKEREDLTYA